MRIQSIESESTEALGAKIGAQLKGGEVIELCSDLGGGKTTFTRGLVRGAGSGDHVSSPTFTVSKIYQAKNMQIHHFDLYRLPELGIMSYEISEIQQDSQNILVLEWAGVANAVLPKNRLIINFETISEYDREIAITCPESLAYLIKNVI